MSQVVSIPKFRSARRLVLWMEKNWKSLPREGYRLPSDREEVFFGSRKESPEELAACAARYSAWAGRLGERFEELLKPFHDSLVTYIRCVRQRGQEIPVSLLDCLSGDSRNIWRLGKEIGRLPAHLEATISEPKYALMYAKDVVRGRLPSEVEMVFVKDANYLSKYAFEVIRGFSSVRLPDALHAFMVMKSFECPGNEAIRRYIQAS